MSNLLLLNIDWPTMNAELEGDPEGGIIPAHLVSAVLGNIFHQERNPG